MAIILALVVAFVGPMFIDWTAYRSAFEAEASRALGTRVRVLGDMELRLLPSPWLTAREVRVGPADQALVSVGEITVDIDLTPLLRGEVRVLDLTLTRPVVRIALDADGRLASFTAAASPGGPARPWPDPEAVRIERLAITDGSVEVLRPGRETVRLDAISGRLEAQSLKGPARFDGTVTADDAEYGLKIAAGALLPDGSVRLKAGVTPTDAPVIADFDGELRLDGGRPVAKGTLGIGTPPPAKGDAAPPAPWRLTAEATASPADLRLDGLDLILGPTERALTLSGTGRLVFSEPARFDLSLGARQLDLDRFLGRREGDLDHGLVAWLGRQPGVLALPPPARLAGRVRLDVPAAVLGGAVVSGLHIEAAPTVDGWRLIDGTVTLPGKAVVSGHGAVVPGKGFLGTASLAADQPSVLAAWLTGPVPAGTPALPPASLGLEGRIGADAIIADQLRIGVESADLAGRGAWQFGAASRLDLTLAGPELDLDAAAALTRMAGRGIGGGPAAASLRLTLDKFALAGLAGRGIDLAMAIADGRLDIDRLTVADLAGARLAAEGSLSGLASEPQGSLRATLDADTLAGVAALARTLAPGNPVADRLAAAAGPLAPAKLEARLSGTAGRFPVANLTLSGTAGGSEVDIVSSFAGRIDLWRAGTVDIRAALTGPDSARLLGQIGIPVVPIGATTPGSLSLTARGIPNSRIALDLAANALGTTASARGGLTLDGRAPPTVTGLAVAVKSTDLTPLALGAGIPALPDGVTVDLTATASGTTERLALAGLSGTLENVALSGDITVATGNGPPRLTGALRTGGLDLTALAGLSLGPDAFTPGPRNGWPTTAFNPVALPVAADLTLTTPSLAVGPLALTDARMRLRLTDGALALDDLQGHLAGGTVTGAVSIGKAGSGASRVEARARLANADAAALSWRDETGKAAIEGRLDLSVDGSAEGRTVAALIAGSSGTGSLSLRDGRFAALDPMAFARVISRAAAGTEFSEAAITRDLERDLAVGPLPLTRLDATLALASGTLRVSGVTAEPPAGTHLTGEASADLTAWTLSARGVLAADPPPGTAVTGALPEAVVTIAGPIEAPRRTVEAGGLTAFLTLGAYERERRKVEELEAERRRRVEEEAARRAKIEEEAQRRKAEADAVAAETAAREAQVQATLRRIREQDPSAATAPDFEARVRALIERPRPLAPSTPAPAPAPR